MIFAVDFDNTFTRDPELFATFIKLAEHRGHKCYIVTMRAGCGDAKAETEALLAQNGLADMDIIYCHHTFKRKVTSQKGINIDIWIDDLPEGIGDQRMMMCYGDDGVPQTLWSWLDKPIGK